MADGVLPVGDVLTVILGDERSIKLPFLDTLFELWELAQTHSQDGWKVFATAVADHIEKITGIRLTLGEAKNLYEQMDMEYARKKKQREDALQSMLGSPNSTV